MSARERLEVQAYTALRILAGVLFMLHGLAGVFGLFAPMESVGSQKWIGSIIELITGPLISVGLFTRISAFVAAGQMAVAYFQFHWKFHFDRRFFPFVNGGELALLDCFVFLLIYVRAGGPISIDRRMEQRRTVRTLHGR